MHRIQSALLELSRRKDLDGMTLRDIGLEIGESHPQKIKHHLSQLKNKGLLSSSLGSQGLLSVPILGAANCGPALNFAEENLEGYLQLSPKMLPQKKDLFAIRATGNSMNRAQLNGKSIEEGDYVIIDSQQRSPKNGDYVLSTINGLANIKRFCFDSENDQIALISESSSPIPPIYIHADDYADYQVNGQVIQIIKKPKLN